MDSFNYIIPDERGFKADVFDSLLAAGYYRMQHLMFTTNETELDDRENIISVFWLRTLVSQCKLNKAANSILKKCAEFSVSIQPAFISDEIEALFATYKAHVPFSISSCCAAYLTMEYLPDPFTSMMVQVRDNDVLIAVGFFDVGQDAIAGIMNIYHPQYQRYSLGKFLILQKLQYALANYKTYYYTGYISPDITRFDYKLFPDTTAVEVLLPDQQTWIAYPDTGKQYLAEFYLKHLA